MSEFPRYSPLPNTGGDAWIAAEASAIRSIRTQLLRDRGFELGRVQAAGYWNAANKTIATSRQAENTSYHPTEITTWKTGTHSSAGFR